MILTDQDTDEPLDVESISESTPLEFRAVDMWELFWSKQNTSDYAATIDGPDLSQVEFYDYYGHKVHKSRVMLLKGLTAPSFVRPRLRGWGFSVVEALVTSINQYYKANNLIYEVLDEFKVDIFRLDGLATTLLSPDGTQQVQKRVQLANQQKNFQHALTLDKNDEFQQKQLSFAGVAETMVGIRMQVASDMRMPLTKVFGISASGFSSGEDDIENYNGMVESQVRSKTKQEIVGILELKCQQLFGFVPDDLQVGFKPLRVLSSEQEENIKNAKFGRLIQAKTANEISTKEFKEGCNKDNLLSVQLDTTLDTMDEVPDDEEVTGDIDHDEEGEPEKIEDVGKKKAAKLSAPDAADTKEAPVSNSEQFKEEDHPRAGDGKFGKGGGGSSSVKHEVKTEKLSDVRKELAGMHTGGRMKQWIENPDSTTAPEEITVIRKEGKIVGWSGVGTVRIGRSQEQQLSVFVDDSMRGKGLGKQLVADACKSADQDELIYYDPTAPQLEKWIEDAGYDPEPIPEDMIDNSLTEQINPIESSKVMLKKHKDKVKAARIKMVKYSKRKDSPEYQIAAKEHEVAVLHLKLKERNHKRLEAESQAVEETEGVFP